MELLKHWDEQLFLFLNQLHAAWLDPVMLLITKTEFWIPLFAFLIFLIFRRHKKQGWFVLLGVAVTILLADQITSSLMKPFFQRLRPSQDQTLEGLIHIVDGYRGGLYGFASGHAANTTGVAVFVFLLFKEVYRWTWLVFVWAFVMSYSRIYLGVHYPGDIIVGMLIGVGAGYAGYWFYRWVASKFTPHP